MLEIFKLTRITYNQLYEDSISFLQLKYDQADQVFTAASPYGQLLQVVLDLGQLIFYYIEDSINELNIYTAQRPDSIRGLARIAGHNPTRPVSASGIIKLTYNGKKIDMYGNTVMIPNFTTLRCKTNGLTYTLLLDQEAAGLELSGNSNIDVSIFQGSIEAQSFTGTDEDLQSYSATAKKNFNIDNFFVKVYVNNEEWQKYDSMYDMPYEGKSCIVKTGINTGIDIYFGNTFFGKKPPLGAVIRVEYLTTTGNSGNIIVDHNPTFTFLDSGYDIAGQEVDLNSVLNIGTVIPPSFGTDGEPVFLTQLLAPKTSRAYVLANTNNYVYFLQKFNFFSVIDAFNTLQDDDLTDDNIVYLFLIPDVNKRKNTADNYFTIPLELFRLSPVEKDKIYNLIEQSGQKIMTVVNKIVDPVISRYVMFVNITAFEGFNKNLIRQQITQKCSEYFLNNRRRDRIPKSDLISIIETVEGVDSVNVYFVSDKNEQFKKIEGNSEKADIGLDDFGDIVMDKTELVIIRGGWANRYGQYFNPGIETGLPCTLNITFSTKNTQKTLSTELMLSDIAKIKANNS